MSSDERLLILQQIKYMRVSWDWKVYKCWLKWWYSQQIWDKHMSNMMIIMIRMILYIEWSWSDFDMSESRLIEFYVFNTNYYI